jgi:epoxyqueuosine reductase
MKMDEIIKEIIETLEKENIKSYGFSNFPSSDETNSLWKRLQSYEIPESISYLRKKVWGNPKEFVPWARDVITVAIPYNTTYENSMEGTKSDRVWVSRYAYGEDYHSVLRKKLKPIKDLLIREGFKARICVDSFPLFERTVAVKSGIGFIGKNGILKNKKIGSYLFLGEVISDLSFDEYKEFKVVNDNDFCSKCNKCVDSCPTRALNGDGSVNPSKCISSYNVEWRGELPVNAPNFFKNLFGCDICQEVCPYNRKKPLTEESYFKPKKGLYAPKIEDLIKMGESELEKLIEGTSLKRRGAKGIMDNLRWICSLKN